MARLSTGDAPPLDSRTSSTDWCWALGGSSGPGPPVTVIKPVELKPLSAERRGMIWKADMMASMPSMMKSGEVSSSSMHLQGGGRETPKEVATRG